MKRREFLRDSAIAAGALMAAASFGNSEAGAEKNPNGMKPDRISPGELVEIPGGSFEIVDDGTKIPVTV